MRYKINFATRNYLDERLFSKLAYSSLLLLVAMSVWNVSRVSSNLGDQTRLNSEIALLQRKLGAKPGGISEADFNRQKSSIRFYNEIIDRKTKNWLDILALFENVTPDGIALSSLTPDKSKEEMKLEGRARSFKYVQQYVEKLESSENFSNVLLLSHQNINEGVNSRGVQFVITCKVLN